MPVPERGCAELAVGPRSRGDGRGHRREPVGHEVVVRRDDFGLSERRAGDEEGGGKKQTRQLGHVRTHGRCRWTKLRRSSPTRSPPHSFPRTQDDGEGGGVTDYRYPESHVFYRKLGRAYPRIVRGEGCWLYDEQGKGYLDAVGGAYVANLGHSNVEIAEGLARQAHEFGYVSATAFTHGPVEELASELAATLPGGLDKLYFLSSGSEAIEAALKLARQYWIEAGKPSKHKIIALAPAYHGNTMLALSASAREHYQTMFREWLVDVHRIPASYPYRCGCRGQDPTCPACSGAVLEQAIARLGPDTVAAFIAEPVEGSS